MNICNLLLVTFFIGLAEVNIQGMELDTSSKRKEDTRKAPLNTEPDPVECYIDHVMNDISKEHSVSEHELGAGIIACIVINDLDSMKKILNVYNGDINCNINKAESGSKTAEDLFSRSTKYEEKYKKLFPEKQLDTVDIFEDLKEELISKTTNPTYKKMLEESFITQN